MPQNALNIDWFLPEHGNGHLVRDLSGQWWDRNQIISAIEDQDTHFPLKNETVATLVQEPLVSALTTIRTLQKNHCIPLNAAWTEDELESVLRQFSIQTLIIEKELSSRFPSLIHNRNVLLVKKANSRVQFEVLQKSSSPKPIQNFSPNLILLTSGSTGSPKAVPLTLQQLKLSAQVIVDSLEIGPKDTAINFLPMMHIGGLLDLFLAPLLSGGRIIFAKPNDEDLLQHCIDENVTWIQGAPAMLLNILKPPYQQVPKLRFIRSVSAPLSSELHKKLENSFSVPVIEIYGMSETCGVITSNPLPPQNRKIGSVGTTTDFEIKIISSDENHSGEIWIKGPRLFSGYWNSPKKEQLWEKSWFCTGDIGYLDEEGFLFLTGRTKEIINRGGQKISPLEIDHLVCAWPEIKEAASFSFPHPSLGEEVGLAVVLEKSLSLSESNIAERLQNKLAPYKQPRRILFLDSLPRNNSGKLQRYHLSKISSTKSNQNKSPLSETELKLLKIWQDHLPKTELSVESDFFSEGGDSLSMTSLIRVLETKFNISLAQSSLYEASTIRAQAELIESLKNSSKNITSSIAHRLPKKLSKSLYYALQSWDGSAPGPDYYLRLANPDPGPKKPLVVACINGLNEWKVFRDCWPKGYRHAGLRSLYQLQNKRKRKLETLAEVYADDLEKIHPTGDFILVAFCAGGKILERVAQKLIKRGRNISKFFSHDYHLSRPIQTSLTFLYSQDWKENPLNRFPNYPIGFNVFYGNNWTAHPLTCNHGEAASAEQKMTLRKIIESELYDLKERRQTEQTHSSLFEAPEYKIQLNSRAPFFVQSQKAICLEVKITNSSQDSISPSNGLALHTRWINHTGKSRSKNTTRISLPKELAPGESWFVQLTIYSPKSFRFEFLQVAILREGLDWCLPGFEPKSILQRPFCIL